MVGVGGQRRLFPPSCHNSIPALESQTLDCLLKDITKFGVGESGTGIFKPVADCQKDGIGSLKFPDVSLVVNLSAMALHTLSRLSRAAASSAQSPCRVLGTGSDELGGETARLGGVGGRSSLAAFMANWQTSRSSVQNVLTFFSENMFSSITKFTQSSMSSGQGLASCMVSVTSIRWRSVIFWPMATGARALVSSAVGRLARRRGRLAECYQSQVRRILGVEGCATSASLCV